MECALHPAILLIAKIGVNRSVVMPNIWKTTPEYESTLGKIGAPDRCFSALVSIARAVSYIFCCPQSHCEISPYVLKNSVARIPCLVYSMSEPHNSLSFCESLRHVLLGVRWVSHLLDGSKCGFVSPSVQRPSKSGDPGGDYGVHVRKSRRCNGT